MSVTDTITKINKDIRHVKIIFINSIIVCFVVFAAIKVTVQSVIKGRVSLDRSKYQTILDVPEDIPVLDIFVKKGDNVKIGYVVMTIDKAQLMTTCLLYEKVLLELFRKKIDILSSSVDKSLIDTVLYNEIPSVSFCDGRKIVFSKDNKESALETEDKLNDLKAKYAAAVRCDTDDECIGDSDELAVLKRDINLLEKKKGKIKKNVTVDLQEFATKLNDLSDVQFGINKAIKMLESYRHYLIHSNIVSECNCIIADVDKSRRYVKFQTVDSEKDPSFEIVILKNQISKILASDAIYIISDKGKIRIKVSESVSDVDGDLGMVRAMLYEMSDENLLKLQVLDGKIVQISLPSMSLYKLIN